MKPALPPALLALCAGIGFAIGPAAAAAPGPAQGRREVPAMSGGIQVNEPDQARFAHALEAVGLDTVQVTVYARQGAWDSADLTFPEEVPAILNEIRSAHAAGLKVVLVLRTYLEHSLSENRHLWHGMIWPREEVLPAWFERYAAFARWGAELAEAEGVELLIIGNELSSMSSSGWIKELPSLYRYFLDEAAVERVHDQRVQCADSVLATGGGEDLSYLDGGRYDNLAAQLDAEARVRAAWTRTVLGLSPERPEDPKQRSFQLRPDLDTLRARRARYERFWRDLIADLRGRYRGPLGYGANFDQFEEVSFWDALDVIAVNAYFPLSRYGADPETRGDDLRGAWRGVADRISGVSQAYAGESESPLPTIFIEMGWTRWRGATVRPWSYDRVEVLETVPDETGATPLTCVHWRSQELDPSERVQALGALREVVADGRFPGLRGFSLWKLTTWSEHRAIEPFAVVVPPVDDRGGDWDEAFLDEAGRLAELLRQR